MTVLGYIGLGVLLLPLIVYMTCRVGAFAWFRTRAEYDRGFSNRKGRE